MKRSRVWMAAGLATAMAFSLQGSSQAWWWNPRPWTASSATPAFKTVRGVVISPSAAATYFGASTTSTDGLCRDLSSNANFCPAGVRPRAPELKEITRALRSDPDLIYEYVRNGIETEYLFGAHKGALGTTIDRSGTAFDQAILLVELLREAGYTARYKFGDMTLNGADFLAWTGVQKAMAACEMLAAGGIPATVNGGSDCNLSGDVTSVVMSHVWVEADIGGQNYQFDPAYKPHVNKTGIDVRSAMGLTTGEAYSAATSGSSVSGDGKTVSGLNASGLATKLETFTAALRTRFQQADMNGAGIADVVGGREIIAAARPVGGWRQTSLSYVSAVRATWSGGVPDQFRAVMTITGQRHSGRAPFSASLFTDEVYGRQVELEAGIPPESFAMADLKGVLFIDRHAAHKGTAYGPAAMSMDDYETGDYIVGLTLNHPFAASSGAYGDATISRRIALGSYAVAFGFGETSSRLASAWSGAGDYDADPTTAPGPDAYRAGAVNRSLMSADWLAQFAQGLKLHSRIAGARETHIHTLGFVFAISNPGSASGYATLTDRVDLLDLETAIALTSLDNDATARRAAMHAIAATAATLEGSVAEQRSDSPDSISTARRFAFANGADDEPVAGQTSNFYRINAADAVPALTAFNPSSAPNSMAEDPRPSLLSAVNAYHTRGFDLVTAAGTLLGPGFLEGSWTSDPGALVRMPSTQRGGAFVAVKYDVNGDPVEIAHVPTSYFTASKGGGGAPQAGAPKDAAALMKDKFVDRSSALGVDLKTGAAGYSSSVIRSVGQGEFPHRLDETMALRGGGSLSHVSRAQNVVGLQRIATGLVSNFDGDAQLSGSGAEAMGASRIEAAAPTIAAFAAMQDIYRQAPAPRREIAGLLAADWWGRKLIRNVLTVSQGGGSEQYVEAGVESGSRLFLPAAGGPGKALVAGDTTLVRPGAGVTDENVDLGLATSRIKLDNQVTVQVLDGQGGTRTYEYWRYGYTGDGSLNANQIGYAQGFRLKTWVFASGVTLTVNYPKPAIQAATSASILGATPTSVTSNLGYTLTLSTVPAGTANACVGLPSWGGDSVAGQTPFLQTFTNAAGGVTKLKFEKPQPWSINQRPVDRCQLVSVYTPKDGTTASLRYTYDTVGKIKEARDGVAIREPGARAAHQFFIADGYRGERQDPAGGRYAVEWLQNGRKTRHIDEMGRVTTSEYDGRGRVTARVLPWLERQEFVYDFRDNVTEMRRISAVPDPWWGQTIVVKAQYHATWNKPTKVILPPTVLDDPSEQEYDYTYNAQGLVTQIQEPQVSDGVSGSPARPTWATTYDGFGRVLTTTDPTGRKTTNAYGEFSQPAFCLTSTKQASQVGGLNLTTTFTCNSIGDVLTVLDPRGNIATTSYDALRRKLETVGPTTIAPGGPVIKTQWVYDLDGNLTDEKKWDATAGLWRTTTTAYSATGKPLSVTSPSGEVARVCYDAMDRERVKIDPEGRATRTTYNASGDPTLVERWFRASVSDPSCAVTADLPAGQTTHAWRSYTYLANGLLASESDARGNATTFVYDGLGRKFQTTYPDPDGAGPQVQPWEYSFYNQRDQLVFIRHRSDAGDIRSTRMFFDAAGRTNYLWEVAGSDLYPKGRLTRTNYDLAGRRVYSDVSDQTTPGTFNASLTNNTRTYAYDAAGRVTQDRFYPDYGTNPGFWQQFVYGYDAASNRTSIQWPDSWTATYTFDAANRMSTVSFTGGSATWAYDSLSRPTSLTRSNGTSSSYAYEPDSDLASVTHGFVSGSPVSAALTYSRDRAGLILYRANPAAYDWTPTLGYARTYGAANALNQVASEAGSALAFDGRGNMTSDGAWTFAYDMRNRLVSATKPGTTATYVYDGDDRRTAKIVNGVVTRILWSGDDELAELDNSGAVVRRYVPGAAVDTPLAAVTAAGAVTWIHADGQGSIVNTSTGAGAAGTPVTYSPYGELGGAMPTGVPFGYTGRYHDAETGLWYYRARYYNPRLGQFLQTDPIGTKDDPNLYLYVGVDPVNTIDPSGNCGKKYGDNQSREDQCHGSWGSNNQAPSPGQRGPLSSENAIQDHYAAGSGKPFHVDPQALGMAADLDIGHQMELSAKNPEGSIHPLVAQSLACKCAVPGSREFAFDGGPFTSSGRSVGRYKGDASFSFRANSDGTFTSSGGVSFALGGYSWNLDGKTLGANAAIAAGALTQNMNKGVPNFVGRPMPLTTTREYRFEAYGKWK